MDDKEANREEKSIHTNKQNRENNPQKHYYSLLLTCMRFNLFLNQHLVVFSIYLRVGLYRPMCTHLPQTAHHENAYIQQD